MPRPKKPPEIAAAFREDLTDPRHGTENGYRNLGCRCDACRAANSRSHFEYMHDPLHPERIVNHRETIARSRAAAKAAKAEEN